MWVLSGKVRGGGWLISYCQLLHSTRELSVFSLSLSGCSCDLSLYPYRLCSVHIHIYVYTRTCCLTLHPLYTVIPLPPSLVAAFSKPGKWSSCWPIAVCRSDARPIAALHSRHVVLLLSSAVSGPRPAHSTAARFTVLATVSLSHIVNGVKRRHNDTRRWSAVLRCSSRPAAGRRSQSRQSCVCKCTVFYGTCVYIQTRIANVRCWVWTNTFLCSLYSTNRNRNKISLTRESNWLRLIFYFISLRVYILYYEK